MNKYSVQVTFSGGYVFEIEAENKKQATEIASELEIDLANVFYWDTDLEITEEN
jgi:hypothetical protein